MSEKFPQPSNENTNQANQEPLPYLSGETTEEVQARLANRMSSQRAQEVAQRELADFNAAEDAAAEAERLQALSEQQLADVEGQEQTGDGVGAQEAQAPLEEAANEEVESAESLTTDDSDPNIDDERRYVEKITRALAQKIDAVDAAVTSILNDKNKKVSLFGARRAALKSNGLEAYDLPSEMLEGVFREARKRSYSWKDAERAAVAEDVAEAIVANPEAYTMIRDRVATARTSYARQNNGTRGFKPGATIKEAIQALAEEGKLSEIDTTRLAVIDGYAAKQTWDIAQTAHRNAQKSAEQAAPANEASENQSSGKPEAKSTSGDTPDVSAEGTRTAKNASKSKERPTVTPSELFDDVRIDRMGELLYHIDNEKLKDAAREKGEKLTWKEQQQQRLAVLESFGMITPERAKELSTNLKGVNGAFNQAYKEWNSYKAEHRETSADAPKAPDEVSTSENEQQATESAAEKRTRLNASIQELRRKILASGEGADRWKYKAELIEVEQQLVDMDANETDDAKRVRLEQEQNELEAKLQDNENSPLRWEWKARIIRIDDELDDMDRKVVESHYENAATELGIDTKQQDKEWLLKEKARLEGLLTEDESRSDRWSIKAELIRINEELADSTPETDADKRARLTSEIDRLSADLSAHPNSSDRWSKKAELLRLQEELDAMAGTSELTEPSDEEFKALRENLEEEYYSLSLEERNSPRGQDLRARMHEADQKVRDIETETRTEANSQSSERIRSEVLESALGERLKTALKNYAEIKAEYDVKGRSKWWEGKAKREERLKEAATELREAKLDIEYKIVGLKQEAGLYEGDEEAINAKKSDDLFDALITLDAEQRAAVNEVHDERAENRNWFQKKAIKIGQWLTRGGKVKTALKPAAAGAALGVTKGAILGFTGAGIPITIAAAGVAAGISLGVRHAAIRGKLEDLREADRDRQSTLTENQIAELRNMMTSTTESLASRGNKAAAGILDKIQEHSEQRLGEARKAANKAMGFFAAGAALGGIGGHMAGSWAHDAWQQWQAPTDTSGGNGGGDGGNGDAGGDGKDKDPTSQNKGAHDADARREALKPELKGNSFFVENGHGVEKEIQEAAKLNGHKISMGRAEEIYEKLYEQYGDKLTKGGPEYHGPTGDLRFGESGKYKWGNGVLEKIVEMSDK